MRFKGAGLPGDDVGGGGLQRLGERPCLMAPDVCPGMGQSKSPGAGSADWKENSLTVIVMLAQLGPHMWMLMETGRGDNNTRAQHDDSEV